jgi:hypothetical protein
MQVSWQSGTDLMKPISRIIISIVIGTLSGVSPGAEAISDSLNDTYLVLGSDERAILEEARLSGLLEIAPVLLPEGENVIDENDHFGWPVAAMSGDHIVVHGQVKLSHYRKDPDRTNNASSIPFVVRSTDAGQTWGPMQRVTELPGSDGAPALRAHGPDAGGMLCIGSTRDGRIVMKHSRHPTGGLLVSADGGATWTQHARAFAGLSSRRTNLGPSIIDHPDFGLMMFSGRPDDKHPVPVLRSTDGGQSWTETTWQDDQSIPKEPEALVFGDGHILLVSREFNTNTGGSDGSYYMQSQHLYRHQPGRPFESISFETQRTNIRGNLASGRWAHDTSGLSFNPVTGRIELLDSHRHGGGPDDSEKIDDPRKSSLNLWSIDPADLLAGSAEWRFECTLVERSRKVCHGDDYADGLHPGAPVIDAKRGLQHIFVYAGKTDKKAGIFRISRTLDTPRLCAWMKDRRERETAPPAIQQP